MSSTFTGDADAATAVFADAVDGLLNVDLAVLDPAGLVAHLAAVQAQRRRLEAVDQRLIAEVEDRRVAGEYAFVEPKAASRDLATSGDPSGPEIDHVPGDVGVGVVVEQRRVMPARHDRGQQVGHPDRAVPPRACQLALGRESRSPVLVVESQLLERHRAVANATVRLVPGTRPAERFNVETRARRDQTCRDQQLEPVAGTVSR